MKTLLVAFVKFYQWLISPAISALAGNRCRFYPSCSHYAIQCLESYEVSKALPKIGNRLVKCGPWHPGGIDLP
jgi:putative membrane protein insertion efficiency factor